MTKESEVNELKLLITRGKKQGYLTYEEINNVLPDGEISPERIDKMMMVFDELDIQIIDGKKIKVLKKDIEKTI